MATPRGEEADRLDYWYDRCDELYYMRKANQLEDDLYHTLADALDDEGVGLYYRALCDPSFNTRPKQGLNPLLRGYPLKLTKNRPPKTSIPTVLETLPIPQFKPCQLYSQRSHLYRI